MDIQEERRHMTPENLTPIVALFDERFNELKRELKESQKEYIYMLEKTYTVKIENMCRDIEDVKKSEDHKDLEDKLNERFLTKMDILNISVKNLESAVTREQTKVEKILEDHEDRIILMERHDADRAKKLIQNIKDNALAWLVPTLLIALAIILGINIPKI